MQTVSLHSIQRSIANHALEGLIFATFGLGVGLVVNQFRDIPLPLIYETKEARLEKAVARLATDTQIQKGTVDTIQSSQTVTLEQLQQFIQKKRGIVFDARPELFHRTGHIPGALSLPQDDFENSYKVYQTELEKDRAQPIIVYCANITCENAALMQKTLQKLGYSNVSVYPGGWSVWELKGLPVEVTQ